MTFLPYTDCGPGGWALPGDPVWWCWILPDAANNRARLEEIILGCAFNMAVPLTAALVLRSPLQGALGAGRGDVGPMLSQCRGWAPARRWHPLQPAAPGPPMSCSALAMPWAPTVYKLRCGWGMAQIRLSLNRTPDLKQFIMGEVLMWNK